ncbi:MAG: MFS transporter [Firmicutes bacterium]|nr:MFS transporter [Bacillota bacterium]
MDANAITISESEKHTNSRVIALLTVAHIINDSYMSLYPPLIPLMMPVLGMNIAEAGLLSTIFSVTSSLSQLAFGLFTDRIGSRFFIFMGPFIAGSFMSLVGIIHNYAILALCIAIAGLGVAAFHPPSSSIVGTVRKERRGSTMSIFVLGGNIGISIMPLVVVPVALAFGLSSTLFLAVPAIIISIILFFTAPPVKANKRARSESFSTSVKANPLAFTSLLGTVAFRSFAFFSLTTYLPKLLHDQGFSPVSAGGYVSILMLSGAVGGLIGGFLSDRLGRKPVIAGSLSASVPFLWLFLVTSGFVKVLFLILAGLCLLAPFSVTVVAAQEIFPNSKATASSISMGFGLGLGGIGIGIVGHVASIFGLPQAIGFVSMLPIIAAAFALGLPGKSKIKAKTKETGGIVEYVSVND